MGIIEIILGFFVGNWWAVLLGVGFTAYFLVVNGLYSLLLVGATVETMKKRRSSQLETFRWIEETAGMPAITVIVPAYNEEKTIRETVTNLLSNDYPRLNITVVVDGSTDDTLKVLLDTFKMVEEPYKPDPVLTTQPIKAFYRSLETPSLTVVAKENGGKADAINAGLVATSDVLVCIIDADTLLEPQAIKKMVLPFVEDPATSAVGAPVRILNADEINPDLRVVRRLVAKEPLIAAQQLEYIRAFSIGRLGWNRLGGNILISGALGVFVRGQLIKAGGYATDTVGEDLEMVVRLRLAAALEKRPFKVQFIPDVAAYTEAPSTYKTLGRQRARWHNGLLDTYRRHRKKLFKTRYGKVSFWNLPVYFATELVAPLVELAGIIFFALGLYLGFVNPLAAVVYFMVAYLWTFCLSLAAIGLNEFGFHPSVTVKSRLRLSMAAVTEMFFYRQLTLIWRLQGFVSGLRRKTEWGAQERKGVNTTNS